MAFNILVPIDGSQCAESAKQVSLQLAAAKPGARLIALHVVKVRESTGNLFEDMGGHLGFEPAVVQPDHAAEARAAGQALLDAFVAEGRALGVAVEPVIEVGAVARTILKHSQDADLLVMGIRGETEDRFQGQGGEMIAWLPPRVPTLVLMLPRGVTRIERVGIGYDGSDGAHRALRAVRTLVDGLDVAVDAFFVSPDGSGGDILAEVDAQLPRVTVRHHVLRGDHPHDALRDAAQAVGDGVLALGFRGRNRLGDFLFGTTTERIAIDGTLGLLVSH